MNDLLDLYMQYTKGTECTPQNTRWSLISCVAAALGRNCYLPFGHLTLYPNMYIFLVGPPATRKSVSMKIISEDILKQSGFDSFAFPRTSREKFLIDFEKGFSGRADDGEIDFAAALSNEMWDHAPTGTECFICADEFVDFIGMKNFNFLNLLTTLYDNKDKYPERLKNSKSILLQKPTINILGGLTPTSLSLVIPQEMIGQGYTSRLVLVHSGKIPRKITFPTKPDPKLQEELIKQFKAIQELKGEVKYGPGAKDLLDDIYQHYVPLLDSRLQHYCSRRFIHLLKLCIIFAAMRQELVITTDIVERANTILSFTENSMHLALGEFGEARHSKATQKIMEVLTEAKEPMDALDLWGAVSQDLDKLSSLAEVLLNLVQAKKIIRQEQKDGSECYLVNRELKRRNTHGIDYEKHIQEYNPGDVI